jgi:hypothetical protein
VKLTREELYDLVWSESMLSLSKKYAISDVGLRKKCKKMEIPLPDLGYWACVQFGKKTPARKPLKKYSGDQYVFLKLREEGDHGKNPDLKSIAVLQEEILNDPKVNLKVPDKLTNPDPIIISVKDDLYKKNVWKNDEGIVNSSYGILSINVSPKNFSRALRIMDTLIKGLKNRGHELISKNGEVYVVVYSENILLSCREKHERELVKGKYYDSTILKPTGKISVRIDNSYKLKEWVDGTILLEDQLHKIIASIELRALKEQAERIEREKRWAIEEERKRIAKELQDRKEKELKDFKDIFQKSKRHEQSEVIRRYANKLENWAASQNELTNELKEKIGWIRRKADWYDPFIEAYDQLLEEVDREKLAFIQKPLSWF